VHNLPSSPFLSEQTVSEVNSGTESVAYDLLQYKPLPDQLIH